MANAYTKAEKLRNKFEAQGWSLALTHSNGVYTLKLGRKPNSDSTIRSRVMHITVHNNGNVARVFGFYDYLYGVEFIEDNWNYSGPLSITLDQFVNNCVVAYASAWPNTPAVLEYMLPDSRIVRA